MTNKIPPVKYLQEYRRTIRSVPLQDAFKVFLPHVLHIVGKNLAEGTVLGEEVSPTLMKAFHLCERWYTAKTLVEIGVLAEEIREMRRLWKPLNSPACDQVSFAEEAIVLTLSVFANAHVEYSAVHGVAMYLVEAAWYRSPKGPMDGRTKLQMRNAAKREAWKYILNDLNQRINDAHTEGKDPKVDDVSVSQEGA